MPLPTFAPPCNPSPGFTDTPEVKIVKSDFGDGYSQESPAGLNNVRRVVENVSWDVLAKDERDQIVAFFAEQKGAAPFYFQFPHDDAPSKWTVEQWSDTAVGSRFHRVSATFRKSFSLAV